jgi:predicted Fe-Mo cluster-binding NifX family protein
MTHTGKRIETMSENSTIAVPSDGEGGLESIRSAHFGHCDCFTLVDVTGDGSVAAVRVVENVAHEHGGCLGPVQLLASHGATAIIAAGMGARPLAGFSDAGIDVLYDPESRRVEDAIRRFTDGTVVVMSLDHSCGCH